MDFEANRASSSKKGNVTFKGAVTKNSKKAKEHIKSIGNRTVLRSVKERVSQALQDAIKTTQDVIVLQRGN